MPKSTVMGNELLSLVFNNILMAGIGDSGSSNPSPAVGSFWISLHTGSPGSNGTQATSEAAYTGYARVGVVRSAAGFTVTGSSVKLTAPVTFGTCSALPGPVITHFGIGDSRTGAGKLRYSGALTPTIAVAIGATPRLDTSGGLVTED